MREDTKMILTTLETVCLGMITALGVCGILEDNGLWSMPVPFRKRRGIA